MDVEELKQQSELTKKLYAKPPQKDATDYSASKLRTLPLTEQQRIMAAIWHRLGALFGSAFESQYGPSGGSTYLAWQDALADLTVQQLRDGLKMCERWDGEFPPNGPKFRGLCVSARMKGPNWTEQRIRDGKSLLERVKHKANTPTAKEELERLQRVLRGDSVESKEDSMRVLELHGARGWKK